MTYLLRTSVGAPKSQVPKWEKLPEREVPVVCKKKPKKKTRMYAITQETLPLATRNQLHSTHPLSTHT